MAELDEAFEAARAQHRAGHPQLAEPVYRRIVSEQPNHAEARSLLGIVELQKGDFAAAERRLREAIELDPEKPNYYNSLSSALFGLGRYADAEAALREAIRRDPGSFSALVNLARVLRKQARTEEAIGCVHAALDADPRSLEAIDVLGNLLNEAGRYEEADAHYRRASEKHPEIGAIQYGRAVALTGMGKLEEAEILCRQTIEAAPEMAELENLLGVLLGRLGRTEEAAAVLRNLILRRPDFAPACNNMGMILRGNRRSAEALDYFRKAVSLNPAFKNAHVNLASALLDLNRRDEAVVQFHEVLRLDPEDGDARHMIAALAGQTTDAPPIDYVRNLFDYYAPIFEEDLVKNLSYQVPSLLRRAVDRYLGVENVPTRRFRRALDLGCGTGIVGREFRDCVDDLIGVDISPRMIEESKSKGIYDSLHEAEIDAYFSSVHEPFDLILAADVFIYVGKLDSIFAAAHRCMVPSGLFAFSVETLDQGTFALRESGRYAQSNVYIESLSAQFGFTIVTREPVKIRKHGAQHIDGHIFVLRPN